MGTHKLILHGGGEHARVVLDCARAQGLDVVSIYDPKYSKGDLYDVPYKGAYMSHADADASAVVAIGENGVRRKVAALTVHAFTNVIHPSVLISPHVVLGKGNMLLQGAILQTGVRVGDHVIVNTGAQIDHDCIIGDYAHIGPGVILCGTVQVGEGTFLGAGSTIIPGVKIGAWSVIGAGSVVITDIPDHAVAVGNPARIIKQNAK